VRQRTAELEEVKTSLEREVAKQTSDLQMKVDELQRVNKVMVGRELRMAELKGEIEKLRKTRG